MDNGTETPTEYTYKNALSLPVAFDLSSEDAHPASVFVEPPGSPRAFERRQPEFFADPDQVGLFANITPGLFSSPPAFIAKARQSRIAGFRTVLSRDGFFFNDDSLSGAARQEEFLARLAEPDPLNEETGLRRNGQGSFFLDSGDRPVEQIPGTTVLLSSAEPSNYGSWLFRVLPKLQTLRPFNLDSTVRFLVWAELPTFREYLRLLGVPGERIIDHKPKNVVYELERAIVPSIRNNQAYLDAESLALYGGLRSQLGVERQPGQRIYVSRLQQSQHGSTRTMQNEAELIARLETMGFRIVCPEKLSVPEQIRTFSSAEMVVGPSGSGMFNIVFCHPGTKIIDIESEPHWIHAHLCLFASCGLRFGIFVGKAVNTDFTTHHKPWRVNIEALIDCIRGFD
jgi:capsular polysaccharide biosynthesis protein